MWDSVSINSIVKSKHTKPYEHKIWYDKVEYITADGPYCTTHDVKVQFFIP